MDTSTGYLIVFHICTSILISLITSQADFCTYMQLELQERDDVVVQSKMVFEMFGLYNCHHVYSIVLGGISTSW